MKFAKVLQEEVVPEWRKAYINYKQGKKHLKAVKSALSKLDTERSLAEPAHHNNDETRAFQLTVDPRHPTTTNSLGRSTSSEPESGRPDHSPAVYLPEAPSDSASGTAPTATQCRGRVRSYDTIQIPSRPTTPSSAPRSQTTNLNTPDEDRSDHSSTLQGVQEKELQAVTKLKVLKQQIFVAEEWKRRHQEKIILNNTGFVKIMKKYDKVAGWKASKAFIASKLRPIYFMTSTTLDDMMTETEDLFIYKFENGHRRRAMAKLRIPDHKNQSHHAATARVGIYLGVAIPLLILGVEGAFNKDTQARILYWDKLLLVYAGLFLTILFACLFGINMYVWKKSRINYKFIFEFDPRDNLDYHEFFELPVFFMLILCLAVYFDFGSHFVVQAHVAYFYPLIAMVTILAILLCPLPIANWSARRWFLQSTRRLIVSGYYSVEFRDFFLGDEMNSLAYSIEQFELAICAYTQEWNDLGITQMAI
ncbi:hypothetical protein BGZ54_009367 [Gamsiella multidivaricata]|nr:hypothetical protein BGZ54_009367 [Gamsiella multidivaricata]